MPSEQSSDSYLKSRRWRPPFFFFFVAAHFVNGAWVFFSSLSQHGGSSVGSMKNPPPPSLFCTHAVLCLMVSCMWSSGMENHFKEPKAVSSVVEQPHHNCRRNLLIVGCQLHTAHLGRCCPCRRAWLDGCSDSSNIETWCRGLSGDASAGLVKGLFKCIFLTVFIAWCGVARFAFSRWLWVHVCVGYARI